MLRTDRTKVFNFENATYGMRNPLESWSKIDSYYEDENFILGENDLRLAMKLRNAGTDHRKFLRQIFVSVDITAPIYWWKEFDTYKVGTVANSTSTMHKLSSRDLTINDLSVDHCNLKSLECLKNLINVFNEIRREYVETKNKEDWYSLIQLLPSSFNQTRTVTLNYENLINIYYARKNHKLDEWHTFCDWIKELPYANELIIGIKPKEIDLIKMVEDKKHIQKTTQTPIISLKERTM